MSDKPIFATNSNGSFIAGYQAEGVQRGRGTGDFRMLDELKLKWGEAGDLLRMVPGTRIGVPVGINAYQLMDANEGDRGLLPMIVAAPDMLAMLEELQYSDYGQCRECAGWKDSHTANCRLAALLKRARGES
jgi:hypothetical protein